MSAAIGTLGKLGIGDTSTVDYALDFRSETFGLRQESMNGNGVRGTLSHTVERVRAGLQHVEGALSLTPMAADYHVLLPWILGAAGTTVSGTLKKYALANAAITKYLSIDRHAKVMLYDSVAVNSAVLRAGQGEFLDAELDLIGKSETVGAAGTFPAIYADVTTNPFILSDLTLTVNATTVTAKTFEVSINNSIDKDRFFNSNTLSAIVKRDREVRFRTQIPYGDFTALYNTGAATGVAVSATFTIGSVVMTVTMPKVVFEPVHPMVPGRSEVMLDLGGRAYRYGTQTDATKDEIVVTLDTGA